MCTFEWTSSIGPVSYTHLDVYKRQEYGRAVQETPESLAFEEELIQRFRLQDDEE